MNSQSLISDQQTSGKGSVKNTTVGEPKNCGKLTLSATKPFKSCPEDNAGKDEPTQDQILASPSLSPTLSPKSPPVLEIKQQDAKVSDEQSVSSKGSATTVDVQARVFKPAFMKDQEDNDEAETADDFFDFSEEEKDDVKEEELSRKIKPKVTRSKSKPCDNGAAASKPQIDPILSSKELNL